MAVDFVPFSVQDYSKDALATDVRRDAESLNFPLLGLFGEVGSLLSEVKKKQRDPTAYRAYASIVTEELGDVLWYFNLVAVKGGVSLAEIVTNLAGNTDDWQKASGENLTFQALQPSVMTTPQKPSPRFEATLIEFSTQVGLLMADQFNKELRRDRNRLAPPSENP